MVRLKQHVPMFVNDGEGGWTLVASTLTELLALPQVALYARDVEPVERHGVVQGLGHGGAWISVNVIHPAPEAERFHQWSISGRLLTVEHNQGDIHRVVGYIDADHPSELNALPPWIETETARLRREAWNRGEYTQPKLYRCAEHGAPHAACCLRGPTGRK